MILSLSHVHRHSRRQQVLAAFQCVLLAALAARVCGWPGWATALAAAAAGGAWWVAPVGGAGLLGHGGRGMVQVPAAVHDDGNPTPLPPDLFPPQTPPCSSPRHPPRAWSSMTDPLAPLRRAITALRRRLARVVGRKAAAALVPAAIGAGLGGAADIGARASLHGGARRVGEGLLSTDDGDAEVRVLGRGLEGASRASGGIKQRVACGERKTEHFAALPIHARSPPALAPRAPQESTAGASRSLTPAPSGPPGGPRASRGGAAEGPWGAAGGRLDDGGLVGDDWDGPAVEEFEEWPDAPLLMRPHSAGAGQVRLRRRRRRPGCVGPWARRAAGCVPLNPLAYPPATTSAPHPALHLSPPPPKAFHGIVDPYQPLRINGGPIPFETELFSGAVRGGVSLAEGWAWVGSLQLLDRHAHHCPLPATSPHLPAFCTRNPLPPGRRLRAPPTVDARGAVQGPQAPHLGRDPGACEEGMDGSTKETLPLGRAAANISHLPLLSRLPSPPPPANPPQGKFKKPLPVETVVFGQEFSKPFKNLPAPW
jgi:hypothetical protein